MLDLLLQIIAMAGGGGSSSGGGGGGGSSSSGGSSGGGDGDGDPITSLIGVAIVVIFMVIFSIRAKRAYAAQQKALKDKLDQSAAADAAWDKTSIQQLVSKVYTQYQRDWSNFNLSSMQTYLTPRYYQHAELMILALKQMNRANAVTILKLATPEIISLEDDTDNTKDSFMVNVSSNAIDRLIDTKDNQILYEQKIPTAAETWRFCRDGNTWRLDGINPYTADIATRASQIQAFAESVGAFYSLDQGRLLIPTRGQLFNNCFDTGDINNHVIGRLQDSGRLQSDALIYQIYTFSSKPANDGGKIYLIGQITVPKYYGNIVIRHRKGLFQSKIKDLEEISTEWGDFNKKYQVFAESAEQLTSFELLNPQMMQWLEAAPFEVNIEVIDNSIYFYAPAKVTTSMSAEDYKTMLGILQGAYRELYR